MDFELNVAKIVKQFNIQAGKVAIAYKTDQTAQRRNDVARRLYLLGNSTILDLNAAIAEKTILAVLTSRLYIIIESLLRSPQPDRLRFREDDPDHRRL